MAISIHAPREGGDGGNHPPSHRQTDFNPRPPRGGRLQTAQLIAQPALFQSTPPARGATARGGYTNIWMHISIHAPREGGDDRVATFGIADIRISIHAPREGGDAEYDPIENYNRFISIHAPREGGDCFHAFPP